MSSWHGIDTAHLLFGVLLILLVMLGSSITFLVAGQSPVGVLDTRMEQASHLLDDLRASLFGESFDRSAVERAIHEKVNRIRQDANRSTLTFDTDLQSIARSHSVTMATTGFLGHEDPAGGTFQDRYAAANYTCQIGLDERIAVGGENVAQTHWREHTEVNGETKYYSTIDGLARGIVHQWNRSSEHRENMLRPYWNNEGIGVARNGSRIYVTQNLC